MPCFPSTRTLTIALATLIGLSLGGCAVNGRPYVSAGYVYGGPGSVAYFDYWYYPGVQVYYDIHRHVYFYLDNGGWIQVRVLPPALRARLGRHVVIQSRYDRPYREYNEHRRRYPQPYYQPPQKKVPDQYRYVPRRDNQDTRRYEQRYEEQNKLRDQRREQQDYRYQAPAKKAPAKDNRRPQDKAKGNAGKADRDKNQKQRENNRSDRRQDRREQGDQYRDRRDYRQ